MYRILFLRLLVICNLVPCLLWAQPGNKPTKIDIPTKVGTPTKVATKIDPTVRRGWTWIPALKTWKRLPSKTGALPVATTERKLLTAMGNYVWAFPDSVVQGSTKTLVHGHWQRARANDLKDRLALNARNMYALSLEGFKLPAHTAPKSIMGANEDESKLFEEEINSSGFLGKDGRLNIHYVKKIRMGFLTFTADQNHIVVTDTLYVNPAQPFSGIVQLSNNTRSFVKIIAQCIVYESPIFLNMMGLNLESDFIFSAEKVFFKSPFALKPFQLTPNPPLYSRAQDLKTTVYRDYFFSKDDITLMNRLFVKIMESNFTQLNSTVDVWARDKLVNQFQYYRTRIRKETGGLRNDPFFENKFNQICKAFDEKNIKIETVRSIGTLPILADANIFPIKPIRYYALPTKAHLLPLMADSTQLLGSILFRPTGESKLKLLVDAELGYNATILKAAQTELAKKGLILEEKLPKNLLFIAEQPLKIKGKTIGKISPLSNQIVRLEMDLPEESKTLVELFPKVGSLIFKIDFQVEGMQSPLSQDLVLEVDAALLSQLDYSKPLESFDVLENSNLTSLLKLSSNLDAARMDEGALNYAEILVEFEFGDKTMLRGPYRLSSYNTLASEILIPFIKKSNDFAITISGRAVYEDGERNIVPFTTNSELILIDESVFVKQ